VPELNLSKAHMLGKLFSSSVVKQGAKPDTTVSSSGFLTLYDREFAGPLRGRSASYRIMFEKLQARARSLDRPLLIVETGSLRVLGNWDDGQSTLLWDEFSRFHPAEIHTVDLDPQAAVVVQDACGPAVRAHTGDSVMFLHQFAGANPQRQIDLLYLDSYDFDVRDPFPSAMHHVKELISIRPCLGPGTIVAIDDNFVTTEGHFIGKGYLAMQWFDHLGISCLHEGHQFVWEL